MVSAHGTSKRSSCASEDIINSLPKKLITNIMDRLPIQDAVKTSILSRKWRFNWTMLSQLVFDENFFRYLNGGSLEDLVGVLFQLKGPITKFVLYIPEKVHKAMDDGFAEHINHWIQCLSERGMEELVLINMHKTPLELRLYPFFCQEVKHLKLHNCCLHSSASGIHGLPNLLTLDFDLVTFENFTIREFLTECPLVKIVKLTPAV